MLYWSKIRLLVDVVISDQMNPRSSKYRSMITSCLSVSSPEWNGLQCYSTQVKTDYRAFTQVETSTLLLTTLSTLLSLSCLSRSASERCAKECVSGYQRQAQHSSSSCFLEPQDRVCGCTSVLLLLVIAPQTAVKVHGLRGCPCAAFPNSCAPASTPTTIYWCLHGGIMVIRKPVWAVSLV